jgi:hypothetical protein
VPAPEEPAALGQGVRDHQFRGVNSHDVAATRLKMGSFVAASYRFLVNRPRNSHILAGSASRW